MSVLGSPFYTLLAADSAVTTLLRTYNGGPAIFVNRTIPADFALDSSGKPWIVTDGDVDTQQIDLTGTADAVTREILVYDVNDGMPSEVDAVAMAVKKAFQANMALTVSGYTAKVVSVTGPVQADPVEETIYGRSVTVQVLLEEQ